VPDAGPVTDLGGGIDVGRLGDECARGLCQGGIRPPVNPQGSGRVVRSSKLVTRAPSTITNLGEQAAP